MTESRRLLLALKLRLWTWRRSSCCLWNLRKFEMEKR